MKTTDKEFIKKVLKYAEHVAEANPGKEFQRTIVRQGDGYSLVNDINYLDFYLKSEIIGEVFAIKDHDEPAYSAFSE